MDTDASPQNPPPTPPREAGRTILAWLLGYLVFRFTVGVLRLPVHTPGAVLLVANLLVALGSIGLPIGAIAAVARSRPAVPLRLLGVVGGIGLWLALAFLTPPRPAVLLAFSLAVQDIGKILAAAGLGLTLAGGIREPNILFPAGLFAALADFVVVNFGTVKHALSTSRGAAVVKAVSAQVPSLHPSLVPLTIGPADFLFLGIFLGCAARFGMDLRRTAWVLALVLGLSLVLVPFLGSVPALAPMSLAFLAVNWRSFKLTKQEMVGSIVVVAAAGALFLGYFLTLYRHR